MIITTLLKAQLTLVLPFVITVTYAGGLPFLCNPDSDEPTSPSGAGGAASSALSLGLDDVPASPAASLLASEAAALGVYVTVITKGST
jgi:hypothetical protein